MRVAFEGMPSSEHSSKTLWRVMPSRQPASGVRTVPSSHDEDVGPGGLRQVAVLIGQDGPLGASVTGLEERHLHIEPVQVLGPRVHGPG